MPTCGQLRAIQQAIKRLVALTSLDLLLAIQCAAQNGTLAEATDQGARFIDNRNSLTDKSPGNP